MRLPHISRIFSRISHLLDVNFSRSFGVNFSILPRILIVAVFGVSFLVFFSDQNQSRSNRIVALEKAARTAPSDFNKRLQLALLYEEEFKKTSNLQVLEKALEEARVARQLNGQNLNAQRLLGRLNAANSAEIKKEIQDVVAVVKARPDYQAAWLKLAALYEKLGDEVNASNARSRAKLLNGDF